MLFDSYFIQSSYIEHHRSTIINFFISPGNIRVAWIDDYSAYVGLQKEGQTAVALRTLSQSDTYKVTSYASRQAQLEGVSKGKHFVDDLHSIANLLKTTSSYE